MRPRHAAAGPKRSSKFLCGGSGATHGWIGLVTGAGRRLDAIGPRRRSRLAALHQLIHPGLRLAGDVHLLPQQAEDLVDARRLGQIHVRVQALLLVFGHLVGLEVVVDVARHHVGIGRVRPRLARHREPAAGA